MGAPSLLGAEGVNLQQPESSSDLTKKTINNNDNETPSNKMEETYTSLIQQYLAVLCIDNAIFLAERFVAASKTNHSLHLLGLCHYRNGKPQSARLVLEQAKTPTPAMQYLLAKCYCDLKQYGPAEDALLQSCRTQYRQLIDQHSTSSTSHPDFQNMDEWIISTTPCPVPHGAAGLHLLGTICRNSNRKERAMHYFRMSLQLDPMMWTSYQALCEMGASDEFADPTQIFGVCPAALTLAAAIASEDSQPDTTTLPEQNHRGVLTPSYSLSRATPEAPGTLMRQLDIAGTPSSATMPKTNLFQSGGSSTYGAAHGSTRGGQRAVSMFETPNLTPIPVKDDKSLGGGLPQAPSTARAPPSNVDVHVIRRASKVAARLYYEPSPETTPPPSHFPSSSKPRSLFLGGLEGFNTRGRRSLSTVVPEDSTLVMDTTPMPDRSFPTHRPLFATTEKRLQNNEQKENDENIKADIPKEQGGDDNKDEASVQDILELLCTLGAAYKRLCQFQCRDSIQILHQLPQEHFHTGWVLHQVGQAHFELGDYQNAHRHLDLMQQIEPHRMKGLEVLSTTLWHLKKEVELSHLAQRAVDFDRLCPESWCVVGNCFSLQKEHETALTFFRRSIQLDPAFTYSHTLSGHEYVAVEDFEKAVGCYRDAIRADDRHYNAWYGLGAIYYRQEKYDLAEYHFQRAIDINPQSSVLLCHLGMAQDANGKAFEALDTLAAAFRIDPRNPSARYQRATVYMSLDRPREALSELEKVRDAVPREASVHFAMGRVLKRLGRTEQAMRCFLTALDLDPKDTNLIKAAMDKLDEPDIGDEDVSTY